MSWLILSLRPVQGQETKLVFNHLKGETRENGYLKSVADLNQAVLAHLQKSTNKVTGLVESYIGTSGCYFDEASKQYYTHQQGLLDQQAFTYDQALAVMMYSMNNRKGKAEQILRVLKNNFYAQKNGYTGLLTSYRTAEFDIWGEDMLLAGIDGDRIHVGPNMWVALAALHHDRINHSEKHLGFAIDIAKWAYDLPHFKFSDGSRGAVSMGSGWGPDWSKVYSTENVIDYYAVLKILEQIYHRDNGKYRQLFLKHEFGLAKIKQEIACIKKWLLEVAYNRKTHIFNCGYNESGVDETKALDVISWSIVAIGPEEIVRWGLDPVKMIETAEEIFLIQQAVNDISIFGFDFTDDQGKDPKRSRLIWWEGTGQMIVAYQVMAKFCRKNQAPGKAKEYEGKAIRYLAEMNKMTVLAKLPKGVLPYTSVQPGDQEIVNAFFFGWEIPRGKEGRWVAALSSTIWGFFGLSGFNPLALEQKTIGALRQSPHEMSASMGKVLNN